MYKIVLSLLLLAQVYKPLSAQEFPQQINYQQARSWAKSQHAKAAAAALNLQLAATATKELAASYLPQVYGDLNLQRNLIIPVTPVPAQAFDPTAPEGTLRPLRFSTNWTANVGINASYELFNPSRKSKTAQLKIKQQQAVLEQEEAKATLIFEVSKAYIECLIAQEQRALSTADTVSRFESWQVAKLQFEAGRQTKITLNQLETELNNARINWEDAQRIEELAIAKLRYAMGGDPQDRTRIALNDSLHQLIATYQHKGPAQEQNFLNKKSELSYSLLAAQIKELRQAYLPTVSLKGYYGANYFDNSFQLFKSQQWNGNSYIALGIRMPIFESWDRFQKINQYQLQQQVERKQLQDERYQNQLVRMEASGLAYQQEKRMLLATKNLSLAKESLQHYQLQFSEGRILGTELQKSYYAYALAKNNYLQGAYEFLLAKINIEFTESKDSLVILKN